MCKLVYFLFIFILIRENESFENTLTTATVRPTTSAKPTTMHRRINVGNKLEEDYSTLDLVKLLNARRKKPTRNRSYLYNLDIWCQYQPSKGNCNEILEKYYYNVQLDQCVTFNYSGCEGNKNNFDTLVDCERLCKGVAGTAFLDQPPSKTFCMLQPNSGLCLALFTKYYYDINEKTCKKFIYGGCGGNENKFDTIFSFMETCGETNKD